MDVNIETQDDEPGKVLDLSQDSYLRSGTCHPSKYPRGQRQNCKYGLSKSSASETTSTAHVTRRRHSITEHSMPMFSDLSRELKRNGTSLIPMEATTPDMRAERPHSITY